MIVLAFVASLLLLFSAAFLAAALSGVTGPHKADQAMDRIAIRSVLLLQQALTDPTIRQTQKWEDDAQAIIDSYRKKEGI